MDTKVRKIYLDELQAADFTGLSVHTLRNHRSKGVGLPFVKILKSVRYSLDDIETYMEENTIYPNR